MTAASNSSCGILRKKTERMSTVKGSAFAEWTRMMRELGCRRGPAACIIM